MDWRNVFTSGDVQELTGVSQRQLTYWDVTALVHPSGRAPQGRGSRRLYTVLDVLKVKLVRRLLDAGVSLQKVRRVLRYLTELSDDPAPIEELEIASDGKRILVRRSDENIIDPLAQQFVLRFTLAELLVEMHDVAPRRLMVGTAFTPPQEELGGQRK